jgi:G protein beta subunit-like protein
MASKGTSARHDMSVILVTGSYDHEIRFWEAWSGICSRTIARTGESGVSSQSTQ